MHPTFIMTVNFAEGKGRIGFMSKDTSLDDAAYFLGRTLMHFIKSSTKCSEDSLKVITRLMLGLEDEIDSVQVDIVASKEDQAKAIKREESCCNGRSNCCGQKKKTIIKKPVKKRK